MEIPGIDLLSTLAGIDESTVSSGAFLTLDVIRVLADIANGLMAIPNLIALLALRKLLR